MCVHRYVRQKSKEDPPLDDKLRKQWDELKASVYSEFQLVKDITNELAGFKASDGY